MAEQQASLTLGVRRHVHVGGLCGLGVGFLLKSLPGALCFVDVAIGRLAADALACRWGERGGKEQAREEKKKTDVQRERFGSN